MKSKSPPQSPSPCPPREGRRPAARASLAASEGEAPYCASGASASCEPSIFLESARPSMASSRMFADMYSWLLTTTRVPGTVGRAGAWRTPQSTRGGRHYERSRPRPRRVAVPLVLAGLEDLVDPEDPMQSPQTTPRAARARAMTSARCPPGPPPPRPNHRATSAEAQDRRGAGTPHRDLVATSPERDERASCARPASSTTGAPRRGARSAHTYLDLGQPSGSSVTR